MKAIKEIFPVIPPVLPYGEMWKWMKDQLIEVRRGQDAFVKSCAWVNIVNIYEQPFHPLQIFGEPEKEDFTVSQIEARNLLELGTLCDQTIKGTWFEVDKFDKALTQWEKATGKPEIEQFKYTVMSQDSEYEYNELAFDDATREWQRIREQGVIIKGLNLKMKEEREIMIDFTGTFGNFINFLASNDMLNQVTFNPNYKI